MQKSSNSKKVVLVVDDDRTLLNLYRRLFELSGIDALIASDGEEGLKMIRNEKPDFVVLDIRMPKIDGIEMLRLMRGDKSLKQIPVLILTNFDLEEYREAIKDLGVVDFIVKADIEPKEIVKKVEEYLQ